MMNTNVKAGNADQRISNRVDITDDREVVDAHSGVCIGQLVNISVDGLMIACPNEIEPNSLLQVRIAFPNGTNLAEIEVGIESLWCQDANQSGAWWTGFHIIDISAEHQKLLDAELHNSAHGS